MQTEFCAIITLPPPIEILRFVHLANLFSSPVQMEWRHHASDSTHNPHTTCDTITCDTASLSFSSSSYSYSFSYSLDQPYLLFSPLLLLDIPNYLFNNNTASKSSSPFLSLPFITGMHSPFDLMYLCCRPPLLPLSFFCYPQSLFHLFIHTRTTFACLLLICIYSLSDVLSTMMMILLC